METQNVTLSIPKDVLRKAKIMAVKLNTSLSGLLTQTLEDLVSREDGFDQARRRNVESMRRGFDLGTKGNIRWSREELHDRQPRD